MNKDMATEQIWLQEALGAVQQSTGLIARLTPARQRKPVSGTEAIWLNLGIKGHERIFSALVKRRLTNEGLGYVIAENRQLPVPHILVTSYISPPQAERLRQHNVQFVDTAGNAFLNQPPLYVFVSGKRLMAPVAQGQTTRAFTATGIKTLFALLCCPPLVTASYREIATKAGVSLGAVSQVLEDLKQSGYLLDQGVQGRVWQKRTELIRRWSEAYAERLRPKFVLGRFRVEEENWWREAPLTRMQACWGGEVAAAKLTKYLKPQRKTIYALGQLPKLQAQFGFHPDREGDIELLKKFWSFENSPPDLAPALLIYADLMASGDERNIETAELIYERYLA